LGSCHEVCVFLLCLWEFWAYYAPCQRIIFVNYLVWHKFGQMRKCLLIWIGGLVVEGGWILCWHIFKNVSNLSLIFLYDFLFYPAVIFSCLCLNFISICILCRVGFWVWAMLFYIIMALNCLVNTIKCKTVFMLQLCLLWKISMSHMTSLQLQKLKPPRLPCK